MEPLDTSSVAIDAVAIRRIREEKRLTQLYVAKVVGVTTDTVSRWENNRYPTIMRDNALKLAEALEVDLAIILKQEEESEESGDVDRLKNPKKGNCFIFLFFPLGILLLIFFCFCQIILLHLFRFYRRKDLSPPSPLPEVKF